MTTSLRLIAVAFAAFAAGCSGEPQTVADLTRQGSDNVAIDGYSPVSYFTDGVARRGSEDFAVAHEGVTYWLASADEVAEFNRAPDRYRPAHGGWCSLMLTGSGNLTPADPETFKIVDGRLLMFWSGEFNGQPIDGLTNWESKIEDAGGEAALLGKADKAWQGLLDGTRREKVMFFQPSDEARVGEARRAEGRRQYD